MKKQIEKLVLSLKDSKQLTATQFFTEARKTRWGKDVNGQILVETYNECLGRLFGRGDLSWEEVNRAMKP